MKIVSIEPTPSPNTMKLTLDEKLPEGRRLTYTPDNREEAPPFVQELLSIPGVTGLYHAADFLALDRHPKGDWPSILAESRRILGTAEGAPASLSPALAEGEAAEADPAYGEVKVLVQTFRGIPMQVRVSAGEEEKRASLPARFVEAAMEAGLSSPNLIRERQLNEHGVRYGDLQEVLDEVVRELDAAYDEARLQELRVLAAQLDPGETVVEEATGEAELKEALNDPDWRRRYAALQRMKPEAESLPLLAKALEDPQTSIRRLAAVYLGDLKDPVVLPYLYRALKDSSAVVRRTAGDTLSDLGFPEAGPAMAEALKDSNKLVRWRAARFLYEAGDESAVPALREAQDDPEFEVRMQAQLALERIEGGEAAAGSVWQQMTNRDRG
ncbi:conserved virulence factor C family protein [Paenibacillus aurantius]|uniref:Conserved virulence factor C family protein n=1 Tax=Paenibacillus aurantius TaxID=2918900 RepID=A0AA96LDN2_9BACL|nr:conserved virulence factor C family protein [Paenibacillus aurantius]WNQ11842.1 conserved virulence factor C family protein [Paenibacillus aurantius]